jgi:hypothetical protein
VLPYDWAVDRKLLLQYTALGLLAIVTLIMVIIAFQQPDVVPYRYPKTVY